MVPESSTVDRKGSGSRSAPKVSVCLKLRRVQNVNKQICQTLWRGCDPYEFISEDRDRLLHRDVFDLNLRAESRT